LYATAVQANLGVWRATSSQYGFIPFIACIAC
jgi:hypothetical protein